MDRVGPLLCMWLCWRLKLVRHGKGLGGAVRCSFLYSRARDCQAYRSPVYAQAVTMFVMVVLLRMVLFR